MTLAETSWLLDEDRGQGAPGPAGPHAPSLAFLPDGRFHAHTGVNHLAGTYREDGASLTLHPGPTTLMAGPPERMARERAVVAALEATTGFRIDHDRLTLLDGTGVPLLSYRAGLRALPGTRWRGLGVNNGHQAVVTTEATARLTVAFGADGRASGHTGVNRFSAAYEAAGRALSFGSAATTRMAGPPEAMRLEQQFLAALGRVARWEADGDQLVLRDADGATQLTFSPLTPKTDGQEGAAP